MSRQTCLMISLLLKHSSRLRDPPGRVMLTPKSPRACEERGIDILRKEERNLRMDLERWMERGEERDKNADEKIRYSIGTGK